VLQNDEQTKSCASLESGHTKVSLPIVNVIVKANGNTIRTHALLDPGSNRSFCTLKLAHDLKLNGNDKVLSLETLHGVKDAKGKEVSFDVSAHGRKRRFVKLHGVMAVENFPVLNGSVAVSSDIRQWEHLRDIEVPEDVDVQLLIGQDHPQALKPLEVRCGKDHEPYAVRTVLGWTVNGPVCNTVTSLSTMTTFNAFVQASADVHLESQVERFWKIDSCDDQGDIKEMSIEDKEVIHRWDKSVCMNEGHYVLPIPFRQDSPELPDNKCMAEQRLASLGRRLRNYPNLLIRYAAGMEDLVEKGYAERVHETTITSGVTWYIPHHNVVNVNKPDKLRIVFDCAAKFHGVSLNLEVLQGPDLTNKLLGVLLRFREGKVAIMGDVEAMYHQVRVSAEHRDALRFLWWEHGDLSKDPVIYRMTSHLFGGVWSAICATYALRRTAHDNQNEFPSAAITAVLDNFYVDDCLVSTTDEESASQMVILLSQLLAKGGFRLTKWLSNSRLVMQNVPQSERAKTLRTLDLEHGAILPAERALRVHWNTDEDVLGIHIKIRDPICTKRGLLSIMSSIYDPMGLVGPYVLLAKKIFQSECRIGRGWDDPLNEDNCRRWLKWLHELPSLEDFHIQRCFIQANVDISRFEVHMFSDASQDAYGAVAYLRSVSSDGQIHCAFLIGKSRLAPMKVVTIPRL
jgi:hypothetical protein